MDFRLPQYRREVFLRAYQFHLKYGTMPGCVYFLMPWLAKTNKWSWEQKLWFAFLNGNTQNPVTSWLIFREYPNLPTGSYARESMGRWFGEHYTRLEFDTDRRYHKKHFMKAVEQYARNVGEGLQGDYFLRVAGCSRDHREGFRRLWAAQGQFYSFGRLSMFSYSEYLRIMGLNVDCDQLFLDDLSGSKSHRNGLCKVLGRDDLDWHDSNPAFPGYSKEVLAWLKEEGALLLEDARRRMCREPYAKDVGYFTLESQLCNFKSWFRPNRRYPNVYADMLYGRIKRAEACWGETLAIFWDARAACLPERLLLEKNPYDLGVHETKQNWFRNTGECVMMDGDWPCFANRFFYKPVSQEQGALL
jgi:hypothetical protein